MKKEGIFVWLLIIALMISLMFNAYYFEELQDYEGYATKIKQVTDDYSFTINRAYDTLNVTKHMIIEQADTIENLTVMVLTYQLYMWEYNVTIPELDNITLKWIGIYDT